ncbi:hypothetical protein QN277_029325 [Acacia crassicarpa]|uniref:Uncharacterized protein n=1 Tax=Acacia crassicarpa TaxID=499986 RepID=A0AAE1MKQ8_9FABA|nr:hypothetical protein QN277_029325 [Acacia crassicarpa]
MDDRIEDIIRDVGEETFNQSHAYGNVFSDAKISLYPECKKYQLLNIVLKLVSLKARHGWSDNSVFEMLETFKDMLPDDNVLPHQYYDIPSMFLNNVTNYKVYSCFIFVAGSDPKGDV